MARVRQLFFYFASAAVAVDSGHMTASSSWNRFSPPSNFVNGHVSTMWFMVCRWSQAQEGEWARNIDAECDKPNLAMADGKYDVIHKTGSTRDSYAGRVGAAPR